MSVEKTQSSGFTLIELLTVVAIIGILSAVIFPSLSSSKAKSRDSIRQGDLKSISLAIQNSWQESGYKTWPSNLSPALDSYFSGGVPKDPQGNVYLYTPFASDPFTTKNDFCLGTKLEVITGSAQTCSILGKTFGTDYNYTVVGP